MKRQDILNKVKDLDEQDILPYLYGVLSDGSAMAENWLDELEERNIKTDNDLFSALIDMGLMSV